MKNTAAAAANSHHRFPRRWAALIFALLALVSASALSAGESVVWKKVPGQELKIFIEKPEGWKAADKRTAVVFFFGGGWVGGTAEQFRFQSEALARRGAVGFRVEYRTVGKDGGAPPLECCADTKSSLRWIRSRAAEYGIDPARIVGAGGSAGGHLAAFAAMVDGLDDPADDKAVSCKPNALILFNPVLNNGPGQWGHGRIGTRYREFSPAHHVTKNAPPTCIFLGDQDKLIGVPVLRGFEADMKSAGVRCDVHITPGAGHGFFNKEPHRSETLAKADAFLVSLGWLPAAP